MTRVTARPPPPGKPAIPVHKPAEASRRSPPDCVSLVSFLLLHPARKATSERTSFPGAGHLLPTEPGGNSGICRTWAIGMRIGERLRLKSPAASSSPAFAGTDNPEHDLMPSGRFLPKTTAPFSDAKCRPAPIPCFGLQPVPETCHNGQETFRRQGHPGRNIGSRAAAALAVPVRSAAALPLLPPRDTGSAARAGQRAAPGASTGPKRRG